MNINWKNDTNIISIIWFLLFSFFTVSADLIVRYITIKDDISVMQIIFIRSIIASLILLPFIYRRNGFSEVTPNLLRKYFTRTIIIFSSLSIWFFCLKFAEFTSIIAIGFTSPLFVSLIAFLTMKEKTNIFIRAACLIGGFSGAIIIIKPFSGDFNIYLLFAFFAALLWALSLIQTKELTLLNQSALSIAFFFSLFLIPLSFSFAIFDWQAISTKQFLLILLFAIAGTLSQITVAKAFKHGELSLLMPFDFSQLIFAAIFSYFIFGDIAGINTIFGGIIILSCGYALIMSERRKNRNIKKNRSLSISV